MPKPQMLLVRAWPALLVAGCFNPDPVGSDPSLGTTVTPTGGTTTGIAPTTSGPDGSGTADASGTTEVDPTTPGTTDTTTADPTTTGSTTDSTTTGTPLCGDGVVDDGEECDDMGESAACDADCTLAECGDAVVNATALELCDDANADDTDACVACQPATCGDGFTWAGNEECDDANQTDLDACTNACTFGTILVSGNSNTELVTGMNGLGETFATENIDWPLPMAAGVIIMGRDGGSGIAPNYQPFLDAGGHLFVAGGSSGTDYGMWAASFFASAGSVGWHQSNACASDFNKVGPHPIVDLLPDMYEFSDQSTSYHMLHFDQMGQPPATDLLAFSCEAGPDNYLLATRRYPSGGTFTYLATDIGPYGNAMTQADFVQPLLQGYLSYVRSPAP